MRSIEWQAIDRIPGFMSKAECEWLADQASNVYSWTELGVYCGRSALCVALHLPKNARLTVVDYRLGLGTEAGQSWLTTYQQIATRRPDLTVISVKADSADAAAWLPDSDVVFIDAGHTAEQVSRDITAWQGKCNLICGHDLNCESWPGVTAAVQQSLLQFDNPAGSIWMADATRRQCPSCGNSFVGQHCLSGLYCEDCVAAFESGSNPDDNPSSADAA